MANFTWTWHVPSGTFKSHEMSRTVLRAAVADSVFLDHVQHREAFGKHRGESVTITRVSNLSEPTSAVLAENQDIPEDQFAISTIALTVQELGRSVPFTGFAEDMSMIDLEGNIEMKLREQMGLVIDTLAATAAKRGQIKYVPTGPTTNNITTNGVFGATATSNMNVFHAEQISDYMYDTLKAKGAEGGDYVGIFRQLSLRGIMSDPSWEINLN